MWVYFSHNNAVKKLFITPLIVLAVLLMSNAAFATGTYITSPTDGSTNTSKTKTFSGTTVTNAHIDLKEDGVVIASTDADVNGVWSITTSNIKSGSHSYMVAMSQPEFNIAYMNGQADGTIESVDVNNHEFLNSVTLPPNTFSYDLVVRNSTMYVPLYEGANAQENECSIAEYQLPDMILVRRIVYSFDCNAGTIDVNPDETMAVVLFQDYNGTSFHIAAVDLEAGTLINNFDTEYTNADTILFDKEGQSFFIRVGGGLAKYQVVNGAIELVSGQGYNQDFSSAMAVNPVSGKVAIAELGNQEIRFIDPNDLNSTTTLVIDDNATNFNRLAFSHDGKKLMVVGQDDNGQFHVWEVDMDSQTVSNQYDLTEFPESVGFTPDDSQYVIGDNFNSGVIFFGVPGGSNYTHTIDFPSRSYAMRNSNFIASFPNNDVSDPITISNVFPTASYGNDPSANITSKSVAPGSAVDVSASGFQANSDVTITLHSTPVVLATVKANSAGVIAAKVTIPKNTTLGSHTLVLEGKDALGNATSSVLNLNVAILPATGVDTLSEVWPYAVGLLAIGIVLFFVTRRKSK